MTITLRPYQHHALDGGDPQRGPGVIRCFARHKRVLAVLATGLGKSILFLEAMRRYHARTGRRALVISHREELVTQPITLGRRLGMRVGREQAEHRAGDEPFVSATVQTMAARLDRFSPDEFGLVVVDECHHSAGAAQYQQVLDHFCDAYVMGVTATPQRLDGIGLAEAGFTAVGYSIEIGDAIALGWLVPIRWRRVTIDGLDLGALRIRGGDFEPEALAELMAENAHHVARHTVELAGNRPTMIFCVNRAHAHAQAAALRRYTDARVEVADGTTPRDVRERILADYKSGAVQFLVNVMLWTEGMDSPTTSCVVLARPTRSVGLAMQCIGRGTRPLPGVVDTPELHAAEPELRRLAIATSDKPDMLLLDIAGVGDEMSLATVADALAGKLTPEQRAQLLQLTPDGEQTFDAMAAEALRLAAIEEAKKQRRSEAKRQEQILNPWSAVNVLGMKLEEEDPGAPRATKDLADWLRAKGVERPERLSLAAAEKAKKTICVRAGKGLASYRQMQALQSHGVPAKSTVRMSRDTASKLLDELAAAGGRPASWDRQAWLGGQDAPEARPPAAF